MKEHCVFCEVGEHYLDESQDYNRDKYCEVHAVGNMAFVYNIF
jgi:hypothetical protein